MKELFLLIVGIFLFVLTMILLLVFIASGVIGVIIGGFNATFSLFS